MFMDHFNGYVLRGEYADLGDGVERLWIPAEDIAKIRGIKRIGVSDLKRSGLRSGSDYLVIDARDGLGRKLRLNYYVGNPHRLMLSESGMYMLMMSGRSAIDRKLQYWLADEVIPAIRQYNRYDLPADHPILNILDEVTSELRIMRDIVWNKSDTTLGDLANTN